MENKKRKKGFTLVELMVAMSIFSVVLLVSVSAFISMNNLRAVAMNARESQQKVRMAIEIMSRYSRQAQIAVVTDKRGTQYKELKLYFDKNNPAKAYAVRFKFSGNTLYQAECITLASDCTTWGTDRDMLGGEVDLNDDDNNGFYKNKPIVFVDNSVKAIVSPANLTIKMKGVIANNNIFYNNSLNLETRVIMENAR